MSSYTPLPTDTSTRLVCLQPALNLQAAVEISLVTSDLSKTRQTYEAVSYTWGSKDDTAEIRVNGLPVDIRRNLYQGLVRLRHATTVRYLWVDAISISQSDLDEKAAQVQMIGKIFSSAEHVLIWLGEHADGSQELFRGWRSPARADRILDTDSVNDRVENSRRMLIWTAFLSRVYWHRTWIVQEIALAKHAVIHCGRDLVDWADMIGVRLEMKDGVTDGPPTYFTSSTIDAKDFWSFSKLMDSFRDSVHHVRQIHLLRTKPGAMRDSILTIVRKLDKFKCENKLDRIYALLSLEDSTPVGYKKIKVDYTLSLPELLVDVLAKRYVFRSGKSWLNELSGELQSKHISWLARALELTAEECDELKGLVLAKVHQAQKDANSLIVDRCDIVYAGLSLVKDEV